MLACKDLYQLFADTGCSLEDLLRVIDGEKVSGKFMLSTRLDGDSDDDIQNKQSFKKRYINQKGSNAGVVPVA